MAIVNIIEPNITEEENAENLKKVEAVLRKIANEMRMRESQEHKEA